MSSPRARPSIAGCWCFEVLTADAPVLRPASPAPDRLIRAGLPLSAALHALVAALAIVAMLRHSPVAPDRLPPIEVEFVQQAAQRRGAPATAPPAAPATQAQSADQAALNLPPPASPPRPAPPRPAPPRPEPPPPGPPRPAPPRSVPPSPTPAVNLGNGVEDVDPLSVTSDQMRPPAPDSRFRNLPPSYPADAARAGAEGTVQLSVRVAASGVPSAVVIARSSGNASLDHEARRAVQLWRFRPARSGGQAVPYEYPINIRFSLGER